MSKAYILMGSNLGNRYSYLQQAQQFIEEQCGNIFSHSSLYETSAWGLTDQPAFLNQAITLKTSLSPETLMQSLLSIEEKIGRKRTIKMGPRIIDLDILLIDDIILNTPGLILPHPALPERRFALIPLNEIAPTLLHPVEKKTISELLSSCTDELDVQKISVPAP